MTLFKLGRAGKTGERGSPEFLYRAIMLKEFEAEHRLPWPPWALQRPLLAVLAPIARLLVSDYPDVSKDVGSANPRPGPPPEKRAAQR